MSSEDRLSSDEIQRLLDEKLGQAGKQAAAPKPPPAPAAPTVAAPPPPVASMDEQIESLLSSAEAGVKQASAGVNQESVKAQPFQLDPLAKDNLSATPLTPTPLDLLADVELDLRIELGRTNMRLEDVLQLRGGAIVALDKLAGDPVDVYVNDRMIARGEILVLNENFCVRVTELLTG